MKSCYQLTISSAQIGENNSGPSFDDIFATIKVVLGFGADENLEGQLSQPMTARECGLAHPQGQIRAFFSGDNWSPPPHKPEFLQIGRTWMLPSLSKMSRTKHEEFGLTDDVNIKSFPDGYDSTSAPEGDQGQSDHFDLSSFPVLGADRPYISSLNTHISDNIWSPSKSFLVIPTSPGAELQSDPFPPLNRCNSENTFETEAVQSSAAFGKSKDYSTAEELFQTSANSKFKSSPSELKRGKTGKKIRWQPLKF